MFEFLLVLHGCRNIYGPYKGKGGRKYCVLYYKKGVTRSISYARLLMERHLGRLLEDHEQVDHKDEDPSNDDIGNLQILSIADHRIKSAITTKAKQSRRILVICPSCGTEFFGRRYLILAGKTPCCSRSCASRYFGANQYGKFGVGKT